MSGRANEEIVEALTERLARHPLVWIEDGAFIVRDESLPGFRYDFRCKSAIEALGWCRHLAVKAWITKEHLEQFAMLSEEKFKGKSR